MWSMSLEPRPGRGYDPRRDARCCGPREGPSGTSRFDRFGACGVGSGLPVPRLGLSAGRSVVPALAAAAEARGARWCGLIVPPTWRRALPTFPGGPFRGSSIGRRARLLIERLWVRVPPPELRAAGERLAEVAGGRAGTINVSRRAHAGRLVFGCAGR